MDGSRAGGGVLKDCVRREVVVGDVRWREEDGGDDDDEDEEWLFPCAWRVAARVVDADVGCWWRAVRVRDVADWAMRVGRGFDGLGVAVVVVVLVLWGMLSMRRFVCAGCVLEMSCVVGSRCFAMPRSWGVREERGWSAVQKIARVWLAIECC